MFEGKSAHNFSVFKGIIKGETIYAISETEVIEMYFSKILKISNRHSVK